MPSRLLYAPKVYAYTKNEAGAIYNLTPWIVSGQVQRKVNQVSSAELVLRNPYKKFTTPSTGVAFHPMDPITIYLERIAGFPVRVFTGYLDNTPYYQMYPGTITLQASCTLKRLLYTYFDPSLPFMIAFFTKYGWINTGKGSIINPNALGNSTPNSSNTQLQDASFGKLLWATLYEIGDWQDTDLYIENLPEGLAQRMTQLMSSMEKGQQEASDEFTTFMKAVVGYNAQGSSSSAPTSGTPGGVVTDSSLSAVQKQVAATIISIGYQLGAPQLAIIACLCAGLGESTLMGNPASKVCNSSGYWGVLGGSCKTFRNVNDWGAMINSFYKGGNGFGGGPGANGRGAIALAKSGMSDPGAIALAEENSGQPPSYYGQFAGHAKQILASYKPSGSNKKTGSGLSKVGQSVKKHHSTRKSQAGVGKGLSNAATSANPDIQCPIPGWTLERDDMGVDAQAPPGKPYLAPAGCVYTGHSAPGWPGSSGHTFVFKFDPSLQGTPYNTQYFYVAENIQITAQQGQHYSAGQVIAKSTGPGTGIETGWGATDGLGNTLAAQKNPASAAAARNNSGQGTYWGSTFRKYFGIGGVPGQPVKALKGTGQVGGTPGGGGGTTSSNNAEAFVAELNFPSVEDQVTAIALGAEHKGLMHDQSLMPFIQQLAQGSMRSFQSLPDGSFYAFYPDYFGEFGHHDPYWMIDDIELLSGGINLTDDALATHVFAVGDNCLALDTPIPTPDGWITMDQLQPGNMVFGSDGKPTPVITTSPIHHKHDCYRLIFEDGTSIVSDADHRWETRTYRHRPERSINGDKQCGVYTTKEMYDDGLFTALSIGDKRYNYRIKVAGPLEYPRQELPIDPYIFGCWLGDGDKDAMRLSISIDDIDHFIDQIEQAGYTYNKKLLQSTGFSSGQYYYRVTIYGLRPHLRDLDVLCRKHIPTIYKQSSVPQRMALLQGLMDTDGTIGEILTKDGRRNKNDSCNLTLTDKRLALDCLELIRSLGIRGNFSLKEERKTSRRQYCMNFATTESISNAFRLVRKSERYTTRLAHKASTTAQYRAIVAIEPVESVPVKCISVDTDDHLFLAGEAMIPTHNTWPVNQELLNMLFSAGTINVFNAFLTPGTIDTSKANPALFPTDKTAPGGFIDPKNSGMQAVMNEEEAVKFIERYGARPLVQNYPMVRSNLFEMLLAYQQFMYAWSNQFVTPFTFTFMPELYPGGKVGFPNHGIQMYIQSVTHSFDYQEGGFTTTAEMTAPSLLHGVNAADFPDVPPNMVQALVEPVRNTKSQSQAQDQAGKQLANIGSDITSSLSGLF